MPPKILSVFLIMFWAFLLPNLSSAQEIEVKYVKINTSENSELAPVVKDSVLFFISDRRTNLFVTYMDQDEQLLYRVFKAPLLNDSTTGKATIFAPPGQPRFNAGPLTFSANGALMIATHNQSNRSTTRKNRDRTNPLTLYIAEKRNNRWHKYKRLNLDIPPNNSSGQPSLSQDGRLLFFVSDMEGGEGATDIYVSEKEGDEWSSPRNLGSHINTPGKELFPFIHPSGKLYFTSDGHEGPGGYNIYSIDWQNSKERPVAMPEPINSVSNDFSCFISDDEQWGYFASDRSGNDDIYRFSLPRMACSDPQEVVEDNYCFTFFEDGPFKSDTLPYIYRWDFGDGDRARGLEVDHCFPGPGEYNINLNVVDTLLNEELFSVASYRLNLETTRQIWFDIPDTLQTYKPFNLVAKPREFGDLSNEPVYWWKFGNGDHRIGKEIDYQYKDPGNYQIICSTTLPDGREVCFYRNVTVIDPQE
jgi:hypothetical protein